MADNLLAVWRVRIEDSRAWIIIPCMDGSKTPGRLDSGEFWLLLSSTCVGNHGSKVGSCSNYAFVHRRPTDGGCAWLEAKPAFLHLDISKKSDSTSAVRRSTYSAYSVEYHDLSYRFRAIQPSTKGVSGRMQTTNGQHLTTRRSVLASSICSILSVIFE